MDTVPSAGSICTSSADALALSFREPICIQCVAVGVVLRVFLALGQSENVFQCDPRGHSVGTTERSRPSRTVPTNSCLGLLRSDVIRDVGGDRNLSVAPRIAHGLLW